MQYVASTVAKLVQDCEATGKRRLFLIQTYVIGKERVLLEVCRLNSSGPIPQSRSQSFELMQSMLQGMCGCTNIDATASRKQGLGNLCGVIGALPQLGMLAGVYSSSGRRG